MPAKTVTYTNVRLVDLRGTDSTGKSMSTGELVFWLDPDRTGEVTLTPKGGAQRDGWTVHGIGWMDKTALVAITSPEQDTVLLAGRQQAVTKHWTGMGHHLPVATFFRRAATALPRNVLACLDGDKFEPGATTWAAARRMHEITLSLYASGRAVTDVKAFADALRWAAIPAPEEAAWQDTGLSAADAIVYRQSGMTPDHFPDWALADPEQGRYPAHVADLFEAGLSPEQAQHWMWQAPSTPAAARPSLIRAGYTQSEAYDLVDALDLWSLLHRDVEAGLDPWVATGLPAGAVLTAIAAGVTPDEVSGGQFDPDALKVLAALRTPAPAL